MNGERELTQKERRLKLVLLFCIFIILFLREPSCITHPEFWAEDGTVFFRQHLLLGPSAALQLVGGYLDVGSRILAFIAGPFPLALAPLVYAIESILVAGACCWTFSLNAFRTLLPSDALRAVLCLLAAVGFPEQELIGNLTNIEWFLMLIAMPLTLAPPTSRRMIIRMALFVLGLLIALSAPLTVILLPLIVLRATRTRSVDSFASAMMAGTLIEWAIIARHVSTTITGNFGIFAMVGHLVFAILVALTNQVVAFCLFGRAVVQSVWAKDEWGFPICVLIAFAYIQVVLYRTGSREYKVKARLMIWLIFSSLALAMLRGMQAVYPKLSSVQPFGGHRYFLLACWCFAFLLLAAILERTPNGSDRQRAGLAAAIFLAGAIGNFRVTGHFTADWRRYAPQVQAWVADRRAGRAHDEVVVPISPPQMVIDFPKLAPAPQAK